MPLTGEKKREYYRKWWNNHKELQRTRVKRQRAQIRALIQEQKTVCVVCGEDHPATLDFHHRDPSEKDFSIAEAVRGGWGRQRVLDEIAKCDVLCANCHRKLHAAEAN